MCPPPSLSLLPPAARSGHRWALLPPHQALPCPQTSRHHGRWPAEKAALTSLSRLVRRLCVTRWICQGRGWYTRYGRGSSRNRLVPSWTREGFAAGKRRGGKRRSNRALLEMKWKALKPPCCQASPDSPAQTLSPQKTALSSGSPAWLGSPRGSRRSGKAKLWERRAAVSEQPGTATPLLRQAASKALNELTARVRLGRVIVRCPFALLIAEVLQRTQCRHSRKSKSSSAHTYAGQCAGTHVHSPPAQATSQGRPALLGAASQRGYSKAPRPQRRLRFNSGLLRAALFAQGRPQERGRGPVPKSGHPGHRVAASRDLPP